MELIFELLQHHFQLDVSDWQAPKALSLAIGGGGLGWSPSGQQWRTEVGVEGAIRPGRHSEGVAKKGKRKKEKKEKRKRKKRKKEEERNRKYGEACNYSETKMEHLSCGAPMHVKPDILAPQAILARTRG